jgi:hypothetical protein
MMQENDPIVLGLAIEVYPLLTPAIVERIKNNQFYFNSAETLKAIEGAWQLELQIPELRHKERAGGIVTYSLEIQHPKQLLQNAADNNMAVENYEGYSLMEDYETGGDECLDVYLTDDEVLSAIDELDFEL